VATSKPAGKIVVYAATGFTGKLISAELADRGADLVIAGRDRTKLEAVRDGIRGSAEVAAVALDDPTALRELLADAAVVIGCAGPFTLHGAPLIEAAAETGTHYLDTTGEQTFIRAAFERWGATAAGSGAALVSGMGFDYAPGDMLAALTAEGLGSIEEMTLAYSIRGFVSTRGTTLSALEMVRGGDVVWSGGEYRAAPAYVGEGDFDFPSPIGSRRVGRYPAGEQITVPKHVDVGRMRTLIDTRSLIAVPLGPLGAPVLSGAGLLMRTGLRPALAKLVARLPEGPSESSRRAVRFTIVCDAATASGVRRGVLRGSDVYGSTAIILAEAATRMAAPDYGESGALAPAQAFDPASFTRALEPFGIAVEIEI
jgi:short subunit dehydrogenase-like uncharacterized protein